MRLRGAVQTRGQAFSWIVILWLYRSQTSNIQHHREPALTPSRSSRRTSCPPTRCDHGRRIGQWRWRRQNRSMALPPQGLHSRPLKRLQRSHALRGGRILDMRQRKQRSRKAIAWCYHFSMSTSSKHLNKTQSASLTPTATRSLTCSHHSLRPKLLP
jgi:hypothetical protein